MYAFKSCLVTLSAPLDRTLAAPTATFSCTRMMSAASALRARRPIPKSTPFCFSLFTLITILVQSRVFNQTSCCVIYCSRALEASKRRLLLFILGFKCTQTRFHIIFVFNKLFTHPCVSNARKNITLPLRAPAKLSFEPEHL